MTWVICALDAYSQELEPQYAATETEAITTETRMRAWGATQTIRYEIDEEPTP